MVVSPPAAPSSARRTSTRKLPAWNLRNDSAEIRGPFKPQLKPQRPVPPAQMYREERGGTHQSRLLTPEGEQHLFQLQDSLKDEVDRAQARKRKTATQIAELNALLRELQQVRSQILEANLRLVIGLARQYAGSPDIVDDFISEGNLILVNAIDKFDWRRGFRFSTYATHAVQRHFFRLLQRRQRRKQREVFSPVEVLANVSAPAVEEPEFNPRMANEFIRRFDGCLNPRERAILEQRFGLNGDESTTLKAVAEKVGLSKERVRQLQISAIAKLQTLATQLNLRPDTAL